MGLGAMQALKDADMNDVVVVGFDATPDAAKSMITKENVHIDQGDIH